MKNLLKQKNLKVSVISMAVCGAALVGYNAYSNATMTDQERLFQQNLEALTNGEDSVLKQGYRTGMATTGTMKYPCCVSSVMTDYCDYGTVGCIEED